jgi:hypothetical protein
MTVSTEEPGVTSQSSPLSTWELLRTLGFAEKERKLHFKLGSMELEASQVWNESLVPVVFLTGLYRSPRTIGMVADELPPEVESREQGLAYLAYYLEGGLRDLVTVPAWLQEGRSYQHLLPWERHFARTRHAHIATSSATGSVWPLRSWPSGCATKPWRRTASSRSRSISVPGDNWEGTAGPRRF